MEDGARRASGSPRRAAVWAAGWAVLTSLALGFLVWLVMMTDVLLAFGLTLVSPDAEIDIGHGYGAALILGIAITILGAPLLAYLAQRTVTGSWPEWTTGLVASESAALVGAAAILLVLGIAPHAFVSGL